MAFENYTVRQFMNAWFKGDRSIITEEEYNNVYLEYIDAAGLYQSEEFERASTIHYYNNRINSIKIAIRLQKDFINNFEIPYLTGIPFFKKFGHILYWNNDIQDFILQLDKVEKKEKKYISLLEGKIKELIDEKAKNNTKEHTVKQSRESFIKMLNSLGKIGWKIDNDKTTVEELALMIKQQTEDNNNTR